MSLFRTHTASSNTAIGNAPWVLMWTNCCRPRGFSTVPCAGAPCFGTTGALPTGAGCVPSAVAVVETYGSRMGVFSSFLTAAYCLTWATGAAAGGVTVPWRRAIW